MAATDQASERTNSAEGSRPMAPATRRLVYALVLIPIVPSVSVVGAVGCIDHVGTGLLDEFRWFHVFFSILWVAATIFVWRSLIVWTLGRRWLTALVGLIPFVQVAYAGPLWSTSGCFSEVTDGILRLGQHEIGIGLWVWLSIWVWWGWEKRQMSKTESDTGKAVRMTPTARRIIASIGSIPVVFGSYFIIAIFLDDIGYFSEEPFSEAYAFTGVIAVVVWVLIWRRSVAWSAKAVLDTVISAAGFLAIPIAVQSVFLKLASFDTFEATLMMSPIIGWGLWMAVTVRLWPMRAAELPGAESIPRCINCGYLLKGLRSTRCPECGDERTLDELWEATTGVV
jgi:hypothetical protein